MFLWFLRLRKAKALPILNERVLSVLKENNIDYKIVSGSIKLNQPSPEIITKVNNLLNPPSQINRSAIAATSYPTAWTHMRNYDIVSSQKFVAATKTAFIAAFTAYAKNITTSWQELVGIAAAGYGGYYFVNINTEDLWTIIQYSYREWGPGFFDSNGTFIGDYEIIKEMRVSKYSDGSGGSYGTDARRSSIVEPWF